MRKTVSKVFQFGSKVLICQEATEIIDRSKMWLEMAAEYDPDPVCREMSVAALVCLNTTLKGWNGDEGF